MVCGDSGGERLRGLVEERWSHARERGKGNGERGEKKEKRNDKMVFQVVNPEYIVCQNFHKKFRF